MLHSIDKNRGTHGDSSFMLERLLSSRENPLPLGMGSVNLQLKILYGILDAYGWTAEYRQWVADGAGVTEACASLAQNLAAL